MKGVEPQGVEATVRVTPASGRSQAYSCEFAGLRAGGLAEIPSDRLALDLKEFLQDSKFKVIRHAGSTNDLQRNTIGPLAREISHEWTLIWILTTSSNSQPRKPSESFSLEKTVRNSRN